ncbi:MAG: hypothetical protein J0L81_04845 [Caulobacterales bacterium]|nr:hypothetical protein [Caulobacterales bacterium]
MTPVRTRRSLEELLGPAPKTAGRPIEPHRTAKVMADTELVRLKSAKMRGELVPAADVEAEWSSLLADLRAALLALPARIGSKLALPRETVAAIDDEIRASLAALAASAGVKGRGDA